MQFPKIVAAIYDPVTGCHERAARHHSANVMSPRRARLYLPSPLGVGLKRPAFARFFYAQVEGVWFPMALESGAPGGAKGAKTLYDKVVVNGSVDDRQFSFPAEAPAPKPAAKSAPAAAGGTT